MDLCIKTSVLPHTVKDTIDVSILVLMDLCIKTKYRLKQGMSRFLGFNPCFNGSMYKNSARVFCKLQYGTCFNPCFNGSMYKNYQAGKLERIVCMCFNPCFNGSMYKNGY